MNQRDRVDLDNRTRTKHWHLEGQEGFETSRSLRKKSQSHSKGSRKNKGMEARETPGGEIDDNALMPSKNLGKENPENIQETEMRKSLLTSVSKFWWDAMIMMYYILKSNLKTTLYRVWFQIDTEKWLGKIYHEVFMFYCVWN